MLRFFVTIIEKFSGAQSKRKGGVPNSPATRRRTDAVTIPLSNRKLTMRAICAPDVPAERRASSSRLPAAADWPRAHSEKRACLPLEVTRLACRQAGICSLLPRRTLRSRYNSLIPNLKPSENSEISAQICKWSRPLLTESAPQTEFPLTPRKQSPKKILTGARTHIRNFAKQPISARRSPTFLSQNGPPKTPQGGYKRVPERCTGRKKSGLGPIATDVFGTEDKVGQPPRQGAGDWGRSAYVRAGSRNRD